LAGFAAVGTVLAALTGYWTTYRTVTKEILAPAKPAPAEARRRELPVRSLSSEYRLMSRLVAITCVETDEKLVLSFVSRDFVYGAMTLLLAAGLVAALTFLQGAFSV